MGAPYYRITWVPAALVERATRKLGRRDGDGTSFWDWTQPEFHERHVARARFADAVRAAKRALPHDCFGEVRISRMIPVDQPWGTIEYEEHAVWHVCPDSEPDPDSPDYVPGLQ